jgi:hypothetical protein
MAVKSSGESLPIEGLAENTTANRTASCVAYLIAQCTSRPFNWSPPAPASTIGCLRPFQLLGHSWSSEPSREGQSLFCLLESLGWPRFLLHIACGPVSVARLPCWADPQSALVTFTTLSYRLLITISGGLPTSVKSLDECPNRSLQQVGVTQYLDDGKHTGRHSPPTKVF